MLHPDFTPDFTLSKTEQLIGPTPASLFRLRSLTVWRIAILPCLIIHPTVGRIATSLIYNFMFVDIAIRLGSVNLVAIRKKQYKNE